MTIRQKVIAATARALGYQIKEYSFMGNHTLMGKWYILDPDSNTLIDWLIVEPTWFHIAIVRDLRKRGITFNND